MSSKIEWCDETWNPIIGCSKVSPGCANCYAEKMAFRQANMRPGCEYERVIKTGNLALLRPEWNGKTAFVESAIDKPLHWRKPRRIFVCSMGDLFHADIGLCYLERVWKVMEQCPQHTFLLLTKRPNRMRWFVNSERSTLPNVHIGVSAENQEQADERIPILLQIPAAVRFVSVEPMLGKVDILEWTGANHIDHVICGGESGTGARPMHPDWVRALRDQCEITGTPFLFKQWGEWAPVRWQGIYTTDGDYLAFPDGQLDQLADRGQLAGNMQGVSLMRRIGKHAAGRELDGRAWDQYPGENS